MTTPDEDDVEVTFKLTQDGGRNETSKGTDSDRRHCSGSVNSTRSHAGRKRGEMVAHIRDRSPQHLQTRHRRRPVWMHSTTWITPTMMSNQLSLPTDNDKKTTDLETIRDTTANLPSSANAPITGEAGAGVKGGGRHRTRMTRCRKWSDEVEGRPRANKMSYPTLESQTDAVRKVKHQGVFQCSRQDRRKIRTIKFGELCYFLNVCCTKYSVAFFTMNPMNVPANVEVRSFTYSTVNGVNKNWGAPWLCPHKGDAVRGRDGTIRKGIVDVVKALRTKFYLCLYAF